MTRLEDFVHTTNILIIHLVHLLTLPLLSTLFLIKMDHDILVKKFPPCRVFLMSFLIKMDYPVHTCDKIGKKFPVCRVYYVLSPSPPPLSQNGSPWQVLFEDSVHITNKVAIPMIILCHSHIHLLSLLFQHGLCQNGLCDNHIR